MSTLLRVLIPVLVVAASAAAQAPLLAEDFSGAVGAMPPTGWLIATHQGAPSEGFRFDNPASRAVPAPLQAPVAIVDSDFAGIVAIDTELVSPVFDASSAPALELRWSQLHIPLLSVVEVAVVTPAGRSVVHGPTMAGGLTPQSFAIDITAACNASSQCRISFRYMGNYDWYWMIDDVVVQEPSVVDVGVTAVTSPSPPQAGCAPLGAAATVAVDVRNFGSAAIPAGTMVPASYTLDGGAPVVETFTTSAALTPGATTSFVFATTVDLSQPAAHVLDAATMLGGDSNPANDGVTGHVVSAPVVVSSFPLVEDFDALAPGSTVMPPGWVNDTGDVTGAPGNDDWIALFGPTPSAGTGPGADHTSGAGVYVYVEDSFPGDHAAVNLLTPCLDLASASFPTLAFYRHGVNAGAAAEENTLSVDVITYPGGAVVSDVVAPFGDTGTTAWVAGVVDLSPFAATTLRVRFRASTANAGGFGHDLALDDVSVFEAVPGPGQPPSAGIAALDVNDAVEVNGLGVDSGLPGPYAACVTAGDGLHIDLTAEPHAAVVLFAGPSNPGVLDFGPVGTLDVGSPDGMGGVAGIEIVGNGAAPGLTSALFVIPAGGVQSIAFLAPAVLAGTLVPLQMVAPHSTVVARLSNSVVLTVL